MFNVHGNRMEYASEKPPKLSELLYLAYCIARGLETTYRSIFFLFRNFVVVVLLSYATEEKRTQSHTHRKKERKRVEAIASNDFGYKVTRKQRSNEAFTDFHAANKAEP